MPRTPMQATPQQQAQHQQAAGMLRQNSFERVQNAQRDRQHSWDRTRQRSLERTHSIEHGRSIAKQHSFTFRNGPPEAARPSMDSMDVNGSQLYGYDNDGSQLYDGGSMLNGSQLADGYDMRHATQVGGMLTEIAGGSVFLKQGAHIQSVKNRATLLPRHDSSSFASRNYTVLKELGKGSFSRVQLLRDKRSGVARVLKISEGGMGTKQSQMLKNEIHLLSALDHPNIVKIFEYSEDIGRGQLLMVLEYVGGGDCQQLLSHAKGKPQDESFIAKLIWQLLSGLCYCHARGILHCDIKPENMMLTGPTNGRGTPDCKLIDFGLTHRIDQPSRDFVGTPSYMAPEIVLGTVAYTIKADIWSVGVTACELLASRAPFGRPQDYKGKMEPVLQNIRNYRTFQDVEDRLSRSENWVGRSNNAKDFLESLVIADPADRVHSDQALEHNWMERNKATPTSLNSYMLRSMVKFMGTTPLMRRCLLIIAARVGSPKMQQIGGVFLSIDDQHYGTISRDSLAGAVSSIATCWEPEFDVDDFFDAADQDHKDVLSFLEFAATCLWGSDDTASTIAERAFKALDDDHDGMVDFEDCKHLFRDCDVRELRNLPQNRAFGINEWRFAVSGSAEQAESLNKPEKPKSLFSQFIQSLVCSQDEPGFEDRDEFVMR